MKIKKQRPSNLAVSAAGKKRARQLASLATRDPRVWSWVITMSFDECGELTSYLECSLDEQGDEVWGGGYERCDEGWKAFAISANGAWQDCIGET
jgi:hypothetical protein